MATPTPTLLLLSLFLSFLCGANSATPTLRLGTNANANANTNALCHQFLTVSEYVVANCSAPPLDALPPTCLESFELFAASPTLLLECEHDAPDATTKQSMRQFLTLYNVWQQHHLCALFHTKEEHAARRCGGAAVQTPWQTQDFPLFCEQIFRLYDANRATLDASCARTQFSDAFWEAYADYVASPLCKAYYHHVREAKAVGCQPASAKTGDTIQCERIFQWYTEQRDRIERECLEVHGARLFYKGFYAWKRARGT